MGLTAKRWRHPSGRLCQLMTLWLSESLPATFRQRNEASSAGAVVDDVELLAQVFDGSRLYAGSAGQSDPFAFVSRSVERVIELAAAAAE